MKARFAFLILILLSWGPQLRATVLVGDSTGTFTYPFHTYYMDSRTQVIYSSEEVGYTGNMTGIITGIDFYVTTRPG